MKCTRTYSKRMRAQRAPLFIFLFILFSRDKTFWQTWWCLRSTRQHLCFLGPCPVHSVALSLLAWHFLAGPKKSTKLKLEIWTSSHCRISRFGHRLLPRMYTIFSKWWGWYWAWRQSRDVKGIEQSHRCFQYLVAQEATNLSLNCHHVYQHICHHVCPFVTRTLASGTGMTSLVWGTLKVWLCLETKLQFWAANYDDTAIIPENTLYIMIIHLHLYPV